AAATRRSPTGPRAGWPRKRIRAKPTTRRSPTAALSRRFLIIRNILKAWLVLAVFAVLLGALGWELGGYRLAILFISSAVLPAGGLYALAARAPLGPCG